MAELRNSFPLRIKLVVLIAVALAASLGSILAVGVAIMMDDKGSYIMDYNLTQVQAAANSVENQIQKVLLMTRLLHVKVQNSDQAGVRELYKESTQSLGVKKLLTLSVSSKGLFKTLMAFGDDDGGLAHSLDQLGWDSLRFLNDHVLIGRAPSGDLTVGSLVRGPQGGTAYVAVLTPQLNLPDGSSDFQIYLVDSVGDPLYSNGLSQQRIPKAHLAELLKSILDQNVTSGARKWSSGADDYLASYNRLGFKELTVIGLISESTAYAAVRALFLRSIALGLSVLLISVGLTLIFVKRLTEGLRAMAVITEKVVQGDFAFRVDTRGMKNDEIGALATSFNLMASKIDELMTEAANRVEIRHDKETVTAVQSNLFPEKPLIEKNITFSGSSCFSPQCGGDWWHYDRIGNYAIMIVGKVEGKGLSAAMLTAAAHAAASSFSSTTKMILTQAPNLRFLVSHLNTAIFEASKGKQKMSCFISCMDIESGKLQMINAGLGVPYLHRLDFGGRPADVADRFEPLPIRSIDPLGSRDYVKVDPETFQLKAGDMIFWYTNGLLKTFNLKGELLGMKKIYELMAALYDNFDAQADKISIGMMEKAVEFFGEVAQAPPDDITVVVAAVPKKAYFMEVVEGT